MRKSIQISAPLLNIVLNERGHKHIYNLLSNIRIEQVRERDKMIANLCAVEEAWKNTQKNKTTSTRITTGIKGAKILDKLFKIKKWSK